MFFRLLVFFIGHWNFDFHWKFDWVWHRLFDSVRYMFLDWIRYVFLDGHRVRTVDWNFDRVRHSFLDWVRNVFLDWNVNGVWSVHWHFDRVRYVLGDFVWNALFYVYVVRFWHVNCVRFVDWDLYFIRNVFVDGVRLWNFDFDFVRDGLLDVHWIRFRYVYRVRPVDGNVDLYRVWNVFFHLDWVWLGYLLDYGLGQEFTLVVMEIVTTGLIFGPVSIASTKNSSLLLVFAVFGYCLIFYWFFSFFGTQCVGTQSDNANYIYLSLHCYSS